MQATTDLAKELSFAEIYAINRHVKAVFDYASAYTERMRQIAIRVPDQQDFWEKVLAAGVLHAIQQGVHFSAVERRRFFDEPHPLPLNTRGSSARPSRRSARRK